MIEITSTPVILIAILGTIGVTLPIISISRKEKGSSSFYGAITFGALLASIGYVLYQIFSENILPITCETNLILRYIFR
jgi:NADH-quinone oxidoreductase subunit N